MRNHIKLLRSKFKQYGIDGYVIPKNDDFDFNQDFEIEEGTRSPGWIRYQKRIK